MGMQNPAFSADVFQNFEMADRRSATMTVGGTAVKGIILLALAFATAAITWSEFEKGGTQGMLPWMMGGLIGGLIVGLVTSFKPTWAPFTAPLYAVLEGLFLGGITVIAEARFPGMAIQAIAATFGLFFVMMALYTSRTIRVTNGFIKGMTAAIGAIMLTYLVGFVLRMFGLSIPFLGQANPIGIGIAVVISGIAAFSLLMDFHFIEEASNSGAPKSMEWYGAFGLMVGLVWLYIEVLRLLMLIAQYAGNND